MNTPLETPTATPDNTETAIVTPEVTEQSKADIKVEEFKISGDTLVAEIKALIHQGNIRRIIIKNEEGHTLLEIPLTVGVIGGVVSAALFPVVAALGVIGAMVAHLTVVIERQEPDEPSDDVLN
jgi:Domain of unknown function (DUF4342)